MKTKLKLRSKIFLFLFVIPLIGVSLLAFKTPSNEADWQTQFSVLPIVEMVGDEIRIQNVRDFRYAGNDRITKINYLNKRFNLSQFKAAWYGISHFGGNGLAHVLLSFEFADDEFLVVSIEARLQQSDTKGYDPIKGLFRGYTKTIVLATEQDVIGLRTHIREEPLYLYKLNLPELYTKPLLLNFLREAQALSSEPTFYNTLIDNCMTGLLAQSNRFKSLWSWFDRRIILPGNSDEIAYEMGYIDTSKPFAEIRKNALVDPSKTSIEDTHFTRKIRP